MAGYIHIVIMTFDKNVDGFVRILGGQNNVGLIISTSSFLFLLIL